MADRLVTIATYWNLIEANLAKSRLQEAGLRVTIADDEMVGALWHLSNAISGVKIQVLECDADAALAALQLHEDEYEDPDFEDAPEPELPSVEEEIAEDVPETAVAQEPETVLNRRQENAAHAYRCAMFGLVLFPLQFYVSWLLLKVYLSDDPLGIEARGKVIIAAIINLPCVLLFLLMLKLLVSLPD